MTFLTLLSILFVVVILPFMIRNRIRQDVRDQQNAEQEGFHVLEASAFSLDTQRSYRIPKDPDEYAKMFVPKTEE